ncbi:hypothetical protein DFH07DRAFT_999825 [Mycena maculata]|uniref:Uncharacterized protein n=1 Tax=Mycena maculata TaxID=230809 RepID=A0AAD7HUJ0_9AGAR|nr:hypothetical protein DFH07DRAFT_999825 [Mycena maculata]
MCTSPSFGANRTYHISNNLQWFSGSLYCWIPIASQVAACFASSFDDPLPASDPIDKDIRNSLNQTLVIADLGSCWIALSRTIFDLFVPDAPVGPAAIQNCATGFWKQQELLLREQIILHSRAENLTTGNSENVVIDCLREQLEEVLGRLRVIPALPLRDKFYPEFANISSPLQLATLYLRLGLRLLVFAFISASDSVSDHVSTLSSSLVAFPSVGGAASILAQSEFGPLVVSPFRHLRLNLASVAVNFQAEVSVGRQNDLIETAYSQAQRLWLIDRAKEGEMDVAAHSLYCHKPLVYDDVREAEMEEREFFLLFPSFEDALNVQPSAKSSPSSRIQAEEMQQLVNLHHLISRSDPSPGGIFYQLRERELEGLLKTRFDSLTDTLDDETPVNLNKPYNFYADANILEARKAVAVVATLQTRLQVLSQAKMFADGVAEWSMTRTIRGPLDATDREQQDPTQTVTDYLTTLIPLLDDFICTSPLGQFHAHMQLLGSFELYCVRLADTKTGFLQDTLNCVGRILHATQSHYGLFSQQVSTKLSEQRNGIRATAPKSDGLRRGGERTSRDFVVSSFSPWMETNYGLGRAKDCGIKCLIGHGLRMSLRKKYKILGRSRPSGSFPAIRRNTRIQAYFLTAKKPKPNVPNKHKILKRDDNEGGNVG